MGKIFPIRQGVACQLKWTWNTLRLAEATSASCHRVTGIPLNPETFDNFHNDPVWVDHRRQQLRGEFPQQGCQYCEQIESAGGISDRLLHLEETDLYPPELDHEPASVHVTPRILEVFINNACNLACVYCDESNSSRIEKENQRFGHQVPGVPVDRDTPNKNIIPIVPRSAQYDLLVERFFSWLGRNYHVLRRLQVLGGEPFYQREFHRLIDYVCDQQHPELTLNVVTNLMMSRTVLENFIERMRSTVAERRLKQVHFTVSIDCWGQEQTYVRWGIDLAQWLDNFDYLLSHRWIYISVNSTITSLTIKTLPDLIDLLNERSRQRQIHHAFGIVDGRPCLHPGIMPRGFWSQDFDHVLAVMPRGQKWQDLAYDYMRGIAAAIDAAEPNPQQQINLCRYLDEIDRRRETNWRLTFPWLANHLESHDVVQ